MCMPSCFSHVQLSATLWTVLLQPPLSLRILQAGIIEWVTMPSSRRSSWPRDQTQSLISPALAGRFFTTSTTWGDGALSSCLCCFKWWSKLHIIKIQWKLDHVAIQSKVVSNFLWPRGLQHAGSYILHYLPVFAKIHIHWVSDAIYPSHSLPSPFAFNLSQHQCLFQLVSSLHQVAKIL